MKQPPTRPRPPIHAPAWVPALLFLLVLLLVGVGRAQRPARVPSSTTTTTQSTGRQVWAAEEEGEEEEGGGVATRTPYTCPQDLCKITQLVEGVIGVTQVKVACHDHLRITSLRDIWPHCLPATTRDLDLSGSGLTRLPAGILSHLPALEKL
nr:uncharacterized protein LOC123753601 [Procambarus clarkii]